jgi:methylated-DNA-protein-cysteine methyltransferase related protein
MGADRDSDRAGETDRDGDRAGETDRDSDRAGETDRDSDRAGETDRDSDRAGEILRRVRAIPPGFVRTYGDVSPGAPRLAGYVLANADAADAPWHRVVRADGSLAKGARQRRLLEDEAVPFSGERVSMARARLDDLDVGV